MTDEKITSIANKVKNLISEDLNIPELNDYIIVIARKGMFGAFFDKLWGLENNDQISIRLAKVVK